MFGRFGKKTIPEDTRAHYRRAAGRADAIGVKLVCGNGATVPATLLDLSAGGCAVEFTVDMSVELVLDEVRELIFSSLNRSSIRAWGQIRSLPAEGAPNRYGFMFLETGELFEQLDLSFYKFFNRRRFRRAKPALGETFRAELAFSNTVETVEVHDISLGGAGLVVPKDVADMLAVDSPVALRLFVPKTDLALPHYGIVRHVSPDARGTRVGVAIEVDPGNESKRLVKKAEQALSEYIQRRIDEMDRYNTAYH
ncbi:MAG: PilZ domain-containing protein [Planctomycetota bacterium]